MKIADWRRWGTPQEAAERVFSKISILREDSLLRGAQGKKAWQESEVYRLYLEMGIEAMEKGVPMETIIKDRKEQGRPYLTEEEIRAIGRLNHRLRF